MNKTPTTFVSTLRSHNEEISAKNQNNPLFSLLFVSPTNIISFLRNWTKTYLLMCQISSHYIKKLILFSIDTSHIKKAAFWKKNCAVFVPWNLDFLMMYKKVYINPKSFLIKCKETKNSLSINFFDSWFIHFFTIVWFDWCLMFFE